MTQMIEPQPTVTFTPEQKLVIETFGEGIAVTAGAGSGKTTTLVKKCEFFLSQHPGDKICAVSFTERSTADLRKKLTHSFGELTHHWVTTIHGLCGQIIREFPIEAGYDGEERILSEAEAQVLWELACEALWSEDLKTSVQDAFLKLLDRESQRSVFGLLGRIKSLRSYGALEFLDQAAQESDLGQLKIISDYVLQRYQNFKKRRGVLDFTDLEEGAARALTSSSVAKTLQNRFGLVLVDEFQDTNPLQAKIIETLAKPGFKNLCIVGDPKQSIYRFRDADVSVFQEFCSKLPHQISLSTNFRSLPPILDFINEVCEPVFKESELSYHALMPGREKAKAADSTHAPVLRLELSDPQQLGQWLLSQNDDLHETALLVRRIRGNEKWFKSLQSTGVKLSIGSGGLFWQDPRVRECVAFLKWWSEPGHDLSGAIFLRAPWVGITDQQLSEWIRSGSLQRSFLSSEHPLALALQAYRNGVGRPSEWLEALLLSPEIENEMGTAYLGLWHRAEELSMRGYSSHFIVREFARAVEENRREREVCPPDNPGVLRVLTFHGAKGLEFKRVLLIDFGKKRRAPDSPLLFWDRTKGVHLGRRTDSGERDKESESEWRALEAAKELAENKRIFYVALTRAKDQLVLVFPKLQEKEAPDLWRQWIESASSSHFKQISFESETSDKIKKLAPQTAETQVYRARWNYPATVKRSRQSVTDWNRAYHCERAFEWSQIRPPSGIFVQEPGELFHEEGLSTRELGTRVHEALAFGDELSLKRLEQEVGQERLHSKPLIDWMRQSSLMQEGGECYAELPFELLIADGENEEILVGAIDRLVIKREPHQIDVQVIDFKVTQKFKSDAELIETYELQINVYAEVVERLLKKTSKKSSTLPIQLKGYLVQISGSEIREISVPLKGMPLEGFAERMNELYNGATGVPKPSSRCGFCEFRSQCPEGKAKH